MQSHTKGAMAHKAGVVFITAVGLQFAAVAPGLAQTAAGTKDSAPSEAARRAADSPYRFILQNAAIRERPRAAAPAPEPKEAKRPAASDQAVASAPPRPAPQPQAPEPEQQRAAPAPTPVAVAPQQATPAPAPIVAVKKALVPVRQDPPELSLALMRERPQGRVTVAFDVEPDGSVTNVAVTHSSNPRLNRPSVSAVQNWKFEPIGDMRQLEIELNYSN